MNRLIAGFLLVAGWSSLARADNPPKTPPATPILTLADGGFVAGSLEETDKIGVIRWQSDFFAQPLDFALEAVGSIRFPAPEQVPRPTGAFGFELTGGDTLFGSLLRLDEKSAELDVARLGRVVIDRGRLLRIFRWQDGAELIYSGPNGLKGWREITPPRRAPQPQQRAAVAGNMAFAVGVVLNAQPAANAPAVAIVRGPGWTENGGEIQSSRDGAVIQADVGLPARACLEIELAWRDKPDFQLVIGVTDDEKSVDRAFRFEVWDGELVLLRELDSVADVAPVLKFADGPGRAQFQLFLDQEQGRLLVFSSAGELLAELKLGGQPGVALNAIRLVNVHGDLCLSRLRVGRWDGETPRPLGADSSRLQLTDLSTLRDEVQSFDPATREFLLKGGSGETRIPESKVSNIVFSARIDRQPRTIRALYQDGTRIGGEWLGVKENSLILTSSGVSGTLQLPKDGLRSLDVLQHTNTPRKRDGLVGTLESEGVRLSGGLDDSAKAAGDSALYWHPLAADAASPIRPGVSGRIVYRTPPPPPSRPVNSTRIAAPRMIVNGRVVEAPQPASTSPSVERKSLYLRTGDIIPAEVLKIDENGVWFRTAVSASGFAPHARIKAVEMATEAGGSIRVNKAKFERLLTLPRMQKENPPTHLIRSKNGDILRGRLVAMDEKSLRVEIRLEEKEIARDRVSRIIWLHADETDPSKKVAEIPDAIGGTRVQAVRSDGIRLTFHATRFADGALTGKSTVLGDCKVRMEELDQLLIGGEVEKDALQLAYQNWKLQNAPEPRSASLDGDPSNGLEAALVGKPAPDFELDLLGGTKFHLAESKGSVIILDFWATWCGPCLQTMPQIDRVAHEFADKGVRLIAVNQQETPAQILALLERQKLSPTVALDREGLVSEQYTAYAIPQTVVIDRDGKVTRVFVGGGLKLGDQLREALRELIPAAKP